ncbi:SRPBCC domain-containing protein [Paracoccus tegillarcae]|uniref:ATPase n=1 Tax=Paracoccus tegillarcae TaxID=1529068 RepID=A0A2K9EIA4_9RHOB|nr:SRPBCC domain-containing protein [Paracoccus tegillarcae]AUH34099.1 ATPase [Paracoccus tegillarcae]
MSISDSDMDFTVWAIIDKPREQVFDAVVDPDKLAAYFTTGGARGRMDRGAKVRWEFADFPGPFDVDVLVADAPEQVQFDWPSPLGKGMSRVTFRFGALTEARTKVEVTESGWPATPEGLQAAYGNCMGWSQMLAAMKAWLDHGVVLRTGMYK